MLRYRIFSLLALITCLLSAVSLLAVQSAQRLDARGITADFPQLINGAASLLMGVNASLEQYDAPTLETRLAGLANDGVRYVRQEFSWNKIQLSSDAYDWSASDRIFASAQRHGIQILAVLLNTPEWARAPSGSTQNPAIETMPPRDPQDFAAFAHAFAERYDRAMVTGGQPAGPDTPSAILAYQVWDEPNLSAMWGNGLIDPVGYLKLLRAAGTAIRSVNPAATIVLAGLAPTAEQSDVNLSPNLYLRKLYEAGGRDAFDVAAAKPYGFDLPPDDRRVQAGLLNFSGAILLREEMVANGDAAKAIWLTQWGWNAPLPQWQGAPSIWGSVSEAAQAQYTTQAIERVASEWTWAGALFVSTLQPNAPATDAHWGFALLDQQGKPRLVYQAYIHALAVASAAPRAQVFAEPAGQVASASYKPNPLALFSDGWRFGDLGADIPQRDDAKVSFHFNGDALAVIVRRGDYRAYMFVAIDGKPANLLPVEPRGAYLIMTSPDLMPHIDTIAVADKLGAGEHIAEIHMDRGWNQWALIGWSSRPALSEDLARAGVATPLLASLLIIAAIGLLVCLPRAKWSDLLARRIPRWRPPGWQVMLAALLVWLSGSLTWAQDAATAYRNLGLPVNVVMTALASAVAFWSPVFVISLIALIILFVLIMLRLDIGLALLVFFIPFYLIPQRIFAKAFPMVELLTLMCMASWLARRWLSIGARLQSPTSQDEPLLLRVRFSLRIRHFTMLDIGIIALVLVSILSSLQADFKVEALRELRLVIVEPVLLYLMLRTTQLDEGQVWRLADGFVLGACAIAAIGLVNYARGNVFPAEFGLPRIESVYGSPNNDALYLGRAFPLLLAVALLGGQQIGAETRRWPVRRVLYVAGLVAVSVAILLSQSRGALLLGIPAATVIVCLLAGGRWRVAGFTLLGAMVLGFVILLSGVLTPFLSGTRFANVLSLTAGTGFFRISLWQSAIVMWRDHPILGVGPDNFLYAYRGYYILPAAWQEPNLSHPHNILLDFATRIGVLGLIAGAGMAIGLVREARGALTSGSAGNLRPLAIGLAGLFADMLAHGLVDHSLFLVDLAFVFMLACGLLVHIHRRPYGSAS